MPFLKISPHGGDNMLQTKTVVGPARLPQKGFYLRGIKLPQRSCITVIPKETQECSEPPAMAGNRCFSHTSRLAEICSEAVNFHFHRGGRWLMAFAHGSLLSKKPLQSTHSTANICSTGTEVVVGMATLAWNLKAWYGLLVPDRERGLELVRMEFRRFLHAIILLPVQIIRAGRKIIYRLLGYNGWLKDFFATWQRLQKLECG